MPRRRGREAGRRVGCQGVLIPVSLSCGVLTEPHVPGDILRAFVVDAYRWSKLVLTQAFPRSLHPETMEESPFIRKKLVIIVCSGGHSLLAES